LKVPGCNLVSIIFETSYIAATAEDHHSRLLRTGAWPL
jgi:hypothetical protein